MNGGQSHFALREWRRHMMHPVTLAAMGGTGVVLGLAGPFGTQALLPLAGRLAYWLVLVVVTYGLGGLVAALIKPLTHERPRALRVALIGASTALGVAGFVLLYNLAVFGWWPQGREWPEFLGTLFAIVLIVTTVLDFAGQAREAEPGAAPAPVAAPPAILERLPLDKRGALLALSVEDHYVRVRTARGQELVLMRLSDAMKEVGDTPGAQVHRSHWVAYAHVTAARREGDRAILSLKDGAEIPVSRANLAKIKEAGLLPR